GAERQARQGDDGETRAAAEASKGAAHGLNLHLRYAFPQMLRVIDFINTNRDRYVSELKKYLAIPSISALPEHTGDLKRCAEWTADEMRRIGLENVRLVETP